MGEGRTDVGADAGVDAEADRWRRLAALLPPDRAREVVDCWDIGEQEAGLDRLVSGLVEGGVAISADDHARIAVTAEVWGVREAVEPVLRRCRSRAGGDVRVIEDGEAMGGEPFGLADLVVVPWIACTRCGRLLGRAHRREPWGDLSYLPLHYVLFTPVRLFGPESAWEAFTALTACDR
ncbi:hypothetical protein [Saccharothrix deserti]|uniref:hypothetical protein n=1 Tax=Saccharothrix deserti TaxID=2593674 RepID=UPI00131D07A1|nr:hypothetical protein [Saccharothrix deserti]